MKGEVRERAEIRMKNKKKSRKREKEENRKCRKMKNFSREVRGK